MQTSATSDARRSTASIQPEADCLTLINVFVVAPERQKELVDLLVHATEVTMQRLPGFISASIHQSHDGRRVVNYAQWRSREDFETMLANPEARPHMAQAAAMADFDPILCAVADVTHV